MLILKAAGIYTMVTVPHFKSMSKNDRNRAVERTLAQHLDDLWNFLHLERRRRGILVRWTP